MVYDKEVATVIVARAGVKYYRMVPVSGVWRREPLLYHDPT